MRIDLFAVWFMSGLLSRQAERSPAFAMPLLGGPPVSPDMHSIPASLSFSAEASTI
jgi:hypothetical protein